MSFDIYTASIPVFANAMTNLRVILSKGEAHARAHNIDAEVLLLARLFPDMHPLLRQVQIASDVVKGAAARLAGIEAPGHPDTEASFEELYERVDETLAFVNSVRPEQLQGAAERSITVSMRQRSLQFTGTDYLLKFALPNLYFHIATTYGLLRHNGVALDKADFLGMR